VLIIVGSLTPYFKPANTGGVRPEVFVRIHLMKLIHNKDGNKCIKCITSSYPSLETVKLYHKGTLPKAEQIARYHSGGLLTRAMALKLGGIWF